MSLTFLNPSFLFLLGAGILPILIHRLSQQRAISRKFSAVRLLLQSQRVMARPQRLKHLLLLLLRITAIVSLAFIMARPALTRPGLLAFAGGGSKVVILDNSLSMGYEEERGGRYDLARKAAKEVLENLKGQVAIIPTSILQGKSIQDADIRWMERDEALRELSAIPLSFGTGDLSQSIDLAYQKLKQVKMPKEILMISDMARGDWERFHLSNLGIAPSEPGVTILRIGSAKRDANFAIKDVRLAEGEAVVKAPSRLEVILLNLSDQFESKLVELYLSGAKVDQKSISLKQGGEEKVYFDIFLDRAGWVDGMVKLSSDHFSLDDVFYFPLKAREKVKVLIVDSAPKRSLKESGSYYLLNALNPGGTEGSPFITKVITEEELLHLDPKPYEAVFLLNASRLPSSKLISILEMAKPIFIFLGDRVVSEEYNNFPLIPWRITGPKEAELQKPEKIALIDFHRDSLRSLSEDMEKSLKAASFHRYFKIEGSTKNLLLLQNKDPLLVETDLGRGKIFLFASSADIGWNDLPIKAAYLPLIHGLLKEAVGLSKSSLPASLQYGEPFEGKARPYQTAGPQGGPGIYQFFLQSGEMRRGLNTPLEESDLSKLNDDEIKRKFGTIETKILEYKEGALNTLQSGRKELWPYILAFLLIVLGTEMGVANRI